MNIMMNRKVHIMQQERDPLNLKSLPLVSPPEDDWPAIEAALREHHGHRRLLKSAGWALAVAASLSLAVGLVLYRPGSPSPLDSNTAQPVMAKTDIPVPATAILTAQGIQCSLIQTMTLHQHLKAFRQAPVLRSL